MNQDQFQGNLERFEGKIQERYDINKDGAAHQETGRSVFHTFHKARNAMALSFTPLVLVAALAAATSTYAGVISKVEIKHAQDRIDTDFKMSRQACDSFSGNAKEICMAKAKGNKKIATAELEARDKGTAKSRQAFLVAKAEANYDFAKAKCGEFPEYTRPVCEKEALVEFAKDKVDARLERTVREVNDNAAEKISNAQTQALTGKRDADYNAERERCDSLVGDAKNRCVSDAKARFGII